MSKLHKAPLLEVIFEIKWDVINQKDIIDFQYLHGDLYSNLKDKFPFRESLLTPEVPFDIVKGMPIYRFRKNKNEYPLIQIGPGLLTFNTIDEIYYWENFKKEIDNTISIFSNVYPKLKDLRLIPTLTYVDFFEISLKEQNPIEFINDNLSLNIQQSFIVGHKTNMKDINLTLNYQIENYILSLNLRNGIVNNNKEGLILQTKVIGERKNYSKEDLSNSLNHIHDICSTIFKKITKGKLYNSFK